MNAPLNVEQLLPQLDQTHLDWLEEEAIFILRETVAAFERPALLFSGGKDSCVVLRLAEKAFKTRDAKGEFKGRLPFPLLHVDTGHNFPEVIEFRDRRIKTSKRCSSIASSKATVWWPLRDSSGWLRRTVPRLIESSRWPTTRRSPISLMRRSRNSITSGKLWPVSTCSSGNGRRPVY